jgi:hypothetical protein
MLSSYAAKSLDEMPKYFCTGTYVVTMPCTPTSHRARLSGKRGMERNTAVEEVSFTDLRDIVRELAQAQLRTEARVEELAQAQARTEVRLDTLTRRVEELAQAQLRTENEVTRLRRTLETQIGGLGDAGGYKRRKPSGTP